MNAIRQDAGFSLLELLVVIAVVSTLVVGVTLSVSRNDPTDAAQAEAILEQARDLRVAAMLTGDTHALILADGSLTVERLRGGTQWDPAASVAMDSDILVLQQDPAERDPGAARLLFLPQGQVGPVRFILNSSILCSSEGGALPTCAPL